MGALVRMMPPAFVPVHPTPDGLVGMCGASAHRYPRVQSSRSNSSSRRRCSRRAMNSSSALVTAAFFVFSPLTASARSRSWGSMARLVGMCGPPHINLHTDGKRGGELRRPGAVLAGPSPEAAPVQAPILDRFAHVLRLELGGRVEIGDRARDLEDPVVRPRREREPGDRRA